MNKKFSILTIAVLLVIGLAIFFSSCSKDDPDPIAATSIELVTGGEQTGIIGIALANPVEVIVKDQNGKAFQGAPIAFAVSEGSLSSATATTDAAGKASVTWTLGSSTGTQTLIVTAFNAGVAITGSPVTVNATASSVTDIDGNTYPAVVIGNQIWMAENLKTTKYRDGTIIPNVTSNTEWSNLTTGAFCDHDNNPSNSDTYGRLYNWYAATDVRNICPTGWHLPSDAEWKELEMYLGMSQTDADDAELRGTDEGGKLKETGTTHWLSPNTGATNETGFTALPGFYRNDNGTFGGTIERYCSWWSATENDAASAWYRGLSYSNSSVNRRYTNKKVGFSVRCLRD